MSRARLGKAPLSLLDLRVCILVTIQLVQCGLMSSTGESVLSLSLAARKTPGSPRLSEETLGDCDQTRALLPGGVGLTRATGWAERSAAGD